MTPPNTTRLLAAWDAAAPLPPAGRAVALLAAAGIDAPPLPVGERDRQLLLLRRGLFGPAVEGIADCPECGGRVEVAFDIDDLTGQPAADPTPITADGYAVRWRLPTAGDLAELAGEPSADRLRRRLLERCLLDVRCGPEAVPAADCPEPVVRAVCDAMAAADPLGDLRLAVVCPDCGHGWEAAFDITTYLWREIDAQAGRLLWEVQALAAAFGWSERDILALSARRRRMYLELVEQ